jgi:hypothetical protein
MKYIFLGAVDINGEHDNLSEDHLFCKIIWQTGIMKAPSRTPMLGVKESFRPLSRSLIVTS